MFRNFLEVELRYVKMNHKNKQTCVYLGEEFGFLVCTSCFQKSFQKLI